MSSRKLVALSVCVALSLSLGFGGVAGDASASTHTGLQVTNAELGDDSILEGESVEVTATVENTGDGAGEHVAELYVDDDPVDNRTVTLGAGAAETITFTRTFEEAGEYGIAVDSTDAGTVTVTDANSTENESEPSPDNSTSDTPPDNSTSGDTTSQDPGESGDSGSSNAGGSGSSNDSGSGSSNTGGSGSSNTESSGSNAGGSGSSSSSGGGSGTTDDTEPRVTLTETADTATVRVEDADGDSVTQPVELAGPSDTNPAVSLSALEIDPADRERFEMTVARPAADPGESPPVPNGAVLAYVDLDSAGLGANGTASLRFELDPGAIPDGVGPEDVRVMRYTEGEWTAEGEWTTGGVSHTFDGETHRATLSAVSPVAVVALDPGNVEVVETTGLVDWVRAGHETTTSVTVRNAGDRPDTRTLTIATAGEPVAERTVSLDAGETETVEIAFEPTESGAVTLEGTEIGTLTVGSGDDGGAATPESVDDMPGFGVLSVVLALLVATLVARARRS